MLVDACAGQPVGGLRRQQQVVDADAPVLLPGARLVVPERVEPLVVADRADGVGQAQAGQRAELGPGLRQEQRVLGPDRRIVHVVGGRDDVVVARQNERLFQLKPFMCVFRKPVHPSDFVRVFLGVRRVAVGQVDRRHPQAPAVGRNRRLDEAGMVVGVVAGQAGRDLVELELGQDRDAVERLLAVDRDVVAQRLDLQPRKGVIDGLGFLKANDVGRPLLEPGGQVLDSLLDRIDVPGGDPHRGAFCRFSGVGGG